MKVAVTGASGFIGRHVLAELGARGVGILAASRSADALREWQARADVIDLDLARPSPAQLDALASCDVLVHLAWGGLPNYESRSHFEVELPAQYAFLKSVIEHGARALLVSGTCLEYGLQAGELSEDTATMPTTPYGFAKDALRRQLEFLRRDREFALTWARLFYTYGAGQLPSSLFPLLTAAAARGDKTFDMSSGEQRRDYLPVEEVAHWLVELALRRANDGIVNVCAGKGIRVRDLVEQWIAEHSWKIQINFGGRALPAYEPPANWGARDKLDRLAGARDR